MISESKMKSAKRARNSKFVEYKEVYDPFYEEIVKEKIYKACFIIVKPNLH